MYTHGCNYSSPKPIEGTNIVPVIVFNSTKLYFCLPNVTTDLGMTTVLPVVKALLKRSCIIGLQFKTTHPRNKTPMGFAYLS